MKKLLILLLIVGCTTEPENKEWICKFDSEPPIDTPSVTTYHIFNSKVECEEICSEIDSIQFTSPTLDTTYVPYCSENNP